MKKLIYIIAFTMLFTSPFIYSQEINATVTVNMDRIDADSRIDVQNLKEDVENYINSQRFTENDWEGEPINVSLQIYLTGGHHYAYTAQLSINSQRALYGDDAGSSPALRLIDKEWKFEYQRGAMHSYNPRRFDEFVSMIDYYMLLIIAYDLDTYEELAGQKIYEIAKDIQQRGASQGAKGYATFDDPGEFSKNRLVAEFTDPRFESFRKLITEYFCDGLDMMAEDKETALSNIELIIRDMATYKRKELFVQTAILPAFFHAKYEELVSLFKGYKTDLVWEDLMYLDPTHTSYYSDGRSGK